MPEVEVTLWGSLAALAGDQRRIKVEARDIRELFRKLADRHPGLARSLENDVAVSIDGVIYRDTWSKELPENAEIYLIRRMTGG